MAELNLTEEELLQNHKKERKELQAQIQTMKKSTCKSDKKKRKELTEEISRLEEALEKKQGEELARWKVAQLQVTENEPENTNGNEAENTTNENDGNNKSNNNKNNGNDENNEKTENDKTEENNKNPKIIERQIPIQRSTKAQRRRDKKAIAEKERNQRIIEEEALNVFGKRNVETQAIRKILIERDLMIYEIPSDGHCLYNAVAHQLKILGETPLGLHDLRMKTALYLRENMTDYLPFISNPDSDELLSPEQYEKYCNDVAETCAWGGAIELQVLSHVLKRPIEVIQATGSPYVIGDEYSNGKKVILTYHRHMYELGAHYNSVTKYVREDDS